MVKKSPLHNFMLLCYSVELLEQDYDLQFNVHKISEITEGDHVCVHCTLSLHYCTSSLRASHHAVQIRLSQ